MIEVRDLTKRYGPTLAVDALSFDVRPGVVTGFLGPNGSGKSTTMRLILGLDAPDAGQARIGGRRYRDLRWPLREVGALLEARAFHPGRSARAHLAALAASNAIPRRRVDEVLGHGRPGQAPRAGGPGSSPSAWRSGWASPRRCWATRAVLLLDEPVNGLDPEGIRWIRDLLKSLAAAGPHGVRLQPPDQRDGADGRAPGGDRPGRLLADTSVAELSARSRRRWRTRSSQLTGRSAEYRAAPRKEDVMTAIAARIPAGHYRFRHVARMEWIKLRSLRSTWWTLAITVAGAIAIGVAVGINTKNAAGDLTNNALAGMVPGAAAGRRARRADDDQRVHLRDDPGHAGRDPAPAAGCWPPRRRCSAPWRWSSGRPPRSSRSSRAARRCGTASRPRRWASRACCARWCCPGPASA